MPTFELRDFQVAELAAGAATWNEFGLNAVDNELTIKGFSFVDGSLRQKNFQGTNFNCSVRFEECHFPADTTFDRARFSDNCEFVRCTFSGALSFDNVAALANFALVDCRVEDDAQFLQIAAKMSFSLTRSHFRGSVQISIAPNVNPAFYAFGARFRKSFTLSGQVDSLDAESARFFRAVYLSSLRISQGALLIEAKFRSVVDFAGLSVGQTLCLDKAYFRRRLSLLDATITQSISAVSARFRGEFDCGSSTARTIPRVDLSSAHFYSAVSFENREFLGATIFEQAVFKHAPAFHNAKLFNGTYFTGAVFEDVKSEHAESCYRALRTACSEIDAFVDEQNFFALEARSRREHLSGVHQRLFDLYAWSSD